MNLKLSQINEEYLIKNNKSLSQQSQSQSQSQSINFLEWRDKVDFARVLKLSIDRWGGNSIINISFSPKLSSEILNLNDKMKLSQTIVSFIIHIININYLFI